MFYFDVIGVDDTLHMQFPKKGPSREKMYTVLYCLLRTFHHWHTTEYFLVNRPFTSKCSCFLQVLGITLRTEQKGQLVYECIGCSNAKNIYDLGNINKLSFCPWAYFLLHSINLSYLSIYQFYCSCHNLTLMFYFFSFFRQNNILKSNRYQIKFTSKIKSNVTLSLRVRELLWYRLEWSEFQALHTLSILARARCVYSLRSCFFCHGMPRVGLGVAYSQQMGHNSGMNTCGSMLRPAQ